MESDKIEERLGKQGFEKIAILADNLPVVKEGQKVEVRQLKIDDQFEDQLSPVSNYD